MRSIFWLTLFALAGCTSSSKCVLPTADQADSSKPSLVGYVTELNLAGSLFLVKDSKDVVEVNFGETKKIDLMSQYGGMLDASEVGAGDKIEVWGVGCSSVKDRKIRAAVIKVHK